MTTLRCARCKRPSRRQAKEPRATAKNADQLDLLLEQV